MNEITLEIRDMDSLIRLLTEAKKKGVLTGLSPEKVKAVFSGKDFPMRVPVKLDGLIQLAGNPILKKMFSKKMEEAALKYLKAAAGAG